MGRGRNRSPYQKKTVNDDISRNSTTLIPIICQSFPIHFRLCDGTVQEPTSPSIHRRNWKESQPPAKGLESPSLVRKFSTGSLESSARATAPESPAPAPAPSAPSAATSPRPLRKLSALYGTPPALPVATSSPRLDSRSASNDRAQSPSVTHTTLSLEETIQDISTSSDSSRSVRPL